MFNFYVKLGKIKCDIISKHTNDFVMNLKTSSTLLMLNPDVSCLESSVDPDQHNIKVDYRRWVFNKS